MTEKKLVPPPSGAMLGSAPAVDSTVEALFGRRIEFHPARNPAAGIEGNGDFWIETLNPSSDAVVGASGGKLKAKAAEEKGTKRSDELALDPEISFSITFRRIGAGLANLGNTCFLNSVLQCLTYTEPFAAYLQSGKHKSSCHTPGFCALCALQNHVMSALQSSGKILTPSHLVKNLRSISRNFRNARQEDAHEYMVNLLESMHKCCLPSGVPSESPSAYEKSLVHKIFGGRLRSQVKCTQCSYSSNTFDPFLDLSLEISKAESLSKALSHFTAVEQLDGGAKQYNCQRCKQKVKALKQLTVHKAPYVLTIHLKRFGSIMPGQKIDKKVNFEPTLDLKPFVSDKPEGNLKYTLYGVLVHAGWSTHSGHYYCYVRTSSGLWHSLNDNQVSQVSEKTVLAQKAYMLFYIRNRSSTPKRPNAIGKENLFANKSGNRCPNASLLGSSKITEINSVDRRFFTSKEDISINKIDALPPDKSIYIKKSLSDDLVMEKDSSVQLKNIDSTKAPDLQSNSHAIRQELDRSKGFPLSKESSLDSYLPNDAENSESDTSSKEKSCQMMVKNLVISLSNANNENTVKPLTWSSYSNCSGAVADVAQLNQSSTAPKLFSGNFSKKEADVPSCKLTDDLRPEDFKALNIGNHSREVCVQKDSDTGEISQKSQSGQDTGEILQMMEVNTSCGQSTNFKNHHQKEFVVDTRTDHANGVNNGTSTNTTRRIDHSHKKNILFGPRHVLFLSSALNKKRKLKGRRKKCLNKKNSTRLDLTATSILGDQEASTSHTFNINSKAETRHKRKQFHSHPKEEENICEAKNVCKANDEEKRFAERKQFHLHPKEEGNNCDAKNVRKDNDEEERFAEMSRLENNYLANSTLPEMTLKQNINHPTARDNDTTDKNFVHPTYRRGLEEISVPKWDDEEPRPFVHNRSKQSAKSIGYVLDEWDEEYDRGKMKKVKTTGQFFTSTNPFEEVAKQQNQQKMKKMRFHKSSYANQPFRI